MAASAIYDIAEFDDMIHLLEDVAALTERALEMQYRTKRRYTFGRLLRRFHVLSEEELDEILQEAEDQGILSPAENEDIALADVIVCGRLRTTGAEVYLVVEVSVGVGRHDVERAARRAALLSKTGVQAIPAVAGEWVTPDARALSAARRNPTALLSAVGTVGVLCLAGGTYDCTSPR